MKKIALPLIAVLLLLVGCAIPPITPFAISSINQAEEKTASVGDVFLEYSEGTEQDDPILGIKKKWDSFKYELTILELTNEKVGLQYSEYSYNPGSVYAPAGWMVKPGFNKRFDYAVADKIIRFKGYEFEILGVEKAQLKYRRIK